MTLKFFELTEILDLGLEMFKPKLITTPLAPPTIEEWERILRDLEALPKVDPSPWAIEPNVKPWVEPQPYQPYTPDIPGIGDYPWVIQPYVGDAPDYTKWFTCNATDVNNMSNSANTFTLASDNIGAWCNSSNTTVGGTYHLSADAANGIVDDRSGYVVWGTKTAQAIEKMQLEASLV